LLEAKKIQRMIPYRLLASTGEQPVLLLNRRSKD
jgi:hypothetical protein